MTTANNNGKTEDELTKLNELFAKRYTDEDPEYTEMAVRSNSPPILDDWQQERNTHRATRSDRPNQRRPYVNYQQHRSYSNDHRRDRNAYQPYQDYPNDRGHYRDHSNNRRDDRDRSSHDRQYRDRSPHSRDSRR